MEVCIKLSETLLHVDFDESNFTVTCLQNGTVPADTPYGFIRMDCMGRIARMWVDSYGRLTHLVALSPVKSSDLLKQMIVAYVISRDGHLLWRRKGDSGFKNHNAW